MLARGPIAAPQHLPTDVCSSDLGRRVVGCRAAEIGRNDCIPSRDLRADDGTLVLADDGVRVFDLRSRWNTFRENVAKRLNEAQLRRAQLHLLLLPHLAGEDD